METLILDYAVRHKCWKTFDGVFNCLYPLPMDKLQALLTSKSLQMTIFDLMKVMESSPKRWKTLGGNGEIC